MPVEFCHVQSLYRVCNFIKFGVEAACCCFAFISVCFLGRPSRWKCELPLSCWGSGNDTWCKSGRRKTILLRLGAAPLLWAMGWILTEPQRETLSLWHWTANNPALLLRREMLSLSSKGGCYIHPWQDSLEQNIKPMPLFRRHAETRETPGVLCPSRNP